MFMAHRKPQINRRFRDFEAEKPAVLDEPEGRWDCKVHADCRDKRDHRGSFGKHALARSSTCSPDHHRGEISTDCFRGRDRRGRGSNFRGNRRGTGSRFNSRGAGSKEDLLKAFEGLKFVPASAESEGIDADYLETIDVYLTEKELAMPPASQELRILLKRCSYLKRFDIVPEDVAENLLMATRSEVATFEPGLETSVTLIRESIVPPVFFLQSNEHKDRLNLINLMLTDIIRSTEQGSRTDNTSFERNVAVEPSFLKGVFVRGVVNETVSANECKVYLVDYGVTETVECSRIRSLPDFLCHEPSVGFFSFFYNLQELEELELSGLFERWEVQLKEVNEFQCRVVSSINHDGAEYFYVQLFNYIGGETIEVDLTQNETEEIYQENPGNLDPSKSPMSWLSEGRLNAEVEIQEYMESDYRYVKQVAALFVKSPEEMILLHVTRDGKVPQWFIEMQRYYKDENLSLLHRIETDGVLVNRCYAWYDANCKTWNRGKVTKVMDTKAELWAVDRGEFVRVDMEKMRELNPKFRLSSALSFRAHLAHVAPVEKDIGWSKDATETIKMAFGLDSDGTRRNVKSQKKDNFTNGKLLDALVVEVKELDTERLDNNGYKRSLGIILAEQVPPNRGTIQAKLVESKLAYPTGPCSGKHDLSYLISGEPYYNRDHLLQHLTPKLGRRAAGLNLKLPLKEIVAIFKEPKKLTKAYCPVMTRRDWRKYGRSNTVEDSPHPEWTKSGKHVPATMQKRMGYVNITYEGSGPGQFFIQTQDKWIEFGKMMEDLQVIVEEMPQPAPTEIRPGMLALATSLNKEEFSAWGRVVVVSANLLANLFEVLFIDFGFIYEASLSGIRHLPPYFDTIPSFCQRVHLDFYTKEAPVVPAGYTWSGRAKSLWKKQIVQWSDYSPIYYAWTVRPGLKEAFVYLEEFDQDLHFDRDHRWWYGAQSGEGSDYPTLNTMKNHPLLKQFFTSIGVNIAYEKEADGSKLEFVPIWKTLKDAGLVVSE